MSIRVETDSLDRNNKPIGGKLTGRSQSKGTTWANCFNGRNGVEGYWPIRSSEMGTMLGHNCFTLYGPLEANKFGDEGSLNCRSLFRNYVKIFGFITRMFKICWEHAFASHNISRVYQLGAYRAMRPTMHTPKWARVRWTEFQAYKNEISLSQSNDILISSDDSELFWHIFEIMW